MGNRGRESASPVIKWVGGKSRLLGQITLLLPDDVSNRRYFEPFLGSGAMFFKVSPEVAILSDINGSLINMYKAIRDDVSEVISYLKILESNHNEETYYLRRKMYNFERSITGAARAALFIYLNKTCFNGLYRENMKGEYNSPIGKQSKLSLPTLEALKVASKALSGKIALVRCRFEYVLKVAKQGDFLYFDPPYDPVSETSNFTSYTKYKFDRREQAKLKVLFDKLNKRGCLLMLSNSDTDFVNLLYSGYAKKRISARRSVNSDINKRSEVSELVITNYQ